MVEQREEENGEKSFTVSDKRLFTREGARRAPQRPTETPSPSAPPPKREAPRAEEPRRSRAEAAPEAPREPPPADFSTFVDHAGE